MEKYNLDQVQDIKQERVSEKEEENQIEFNKITEAGFQKLKELTVDVENQEKRFELQHLLIKAKDLSVSVIEANTIIEIQELYFLLAVLFDRLNKMLEISEQPYKEGGKLLKGLDLKTLEFAGRHGAWGDDWPLMNVWWNSGLRDASMTDIDVNYPRSDEYDKERNQNVHEFKLDVVDGSEVLLGQIYDLIYSAGFFGHPTYVISKETDKPVKELEHQVIENLKGYLRLGGFFVFATRENFKLDLDRLEAEGFEILKFKLYQDYLVLRKKP